MSPVILKQLSLRQKGVPNLSLPEVLLGILYLGVALLKELLECLLNIHQFKLFLNITQMADYN